MHSQLTIYYAETFYITTPWAGDYTEKFRITTLSKLII
jgi:hypothetical protein